MNNESLEQRQIDNQFIKTFYGRDKNCPNNDAYKEVEFSLKRMIKDTGLIHWAIFRSRDTKQLHKLDSLEEGLVIFVAKTHA